MSRPGRFFAELPARLRTFARALTHPRRFTREIDDEIAFHLASRTEDLVRAGLSPKEAARQARIEFGAEPAHASAMRRAFGIEWLDSVAADLAYAARLLRRSPGFTAITVLSLALAIGANSAIFSTANEMLFARLDVPHPEQLRTLEWQAWKQSPFHNTWDGFNMPRGGYWIGNVFTYPIYRQLLSRYPSIVGSMNDLSVTAVIAGRANVATTNLVSGNYFSQLEVKPALGRNILPADDRIQDGAPAVAMLSYGYWQREFGGSAAVIGRTIQLDGTLVTIIGVTPAGFTGANSVQIAPDFILPLTAVSFIQPTLGNEHPLSSSEMAWVRLMLRVRPNRTLSQLAAGLSVRLSAAVRGTMTLAKGDSLPSMLLTDGSRGDAMFGSAVQPIYVLLALASLVLLLACVNVANLMLARATVRERELSVRMALGAGRRRLFRQILTECLLISALGGGIGVALAFAARNMIPHLLWNRHDFDTLNIPFNWPVFAFTAGITVLAALLSGLAPAWRATRSQPAAALKQAGGATTRRRAWGGKGLVGLQVALSTLLVAGSLLFLRTMTNLDRVDPGFDPHHLLLLSIDLPQHRYVSPLDLATHRRLLAAVRTVPGVSSASLSLVPFLSSSNWDTSIKLEHQLEGFPRLGRIDRQSDLSSVGLDFLDTMRIPLLAGRTFAPADLDSRQNVAVVNQAFAQRFFGRYNPIGQSFSSDGKAPWTEIIGVCSDIRYSSLREPPPPVYFSLYTQQTSLEQATYLIRSSLPPATLVPSLRRAVARIDSQLPLTDIRTQEEQIRELTQQERLFAALSTGFGILALALACAGVYGVFSYAVAGRTRELGIRLALGAPRASVRTAILREALTLSVLALAVGLGVTLALTRLVHSLLYGVSAADPLSLGATTLLLLAVAVLAAWLPARRASAVDPMHALRHE